MTQHIRAEILSYVSDNTDRDNLKDIIQQPHILTKNTEDVSNKERL